MKAQLRAGSEIDFLTAAELRETLKETLSGFLRPPQTERPEGAILLNASGHSVIGGEAGPSTVSVYSLPAGYRLRLHRAVFVPDGYTFGSPFTAAAGFLELRRNGLMQAGLGFAGTSVLAPGLPAVLLAGSADGIEYLDGEDVQLYVSGGPASTSLSVRLQGTLQPIVRQ